MRRGSLWCDGEPTGSSQQDGAPVWLHRPEVMENDGKWIVQVADYIIQVF